MDADETDVTRLTNDPSSDQYAHWSPNGREIVFKSSRDGNQEIYVMNADGTNVKRLTNNTVNDKEPCWRPQSRIIPETYEFVTKWGS